MVKLAHSPSLKHERPTARTSHIVSGHPLSHSSQFCWLHRFGPRAFFHAICVHTCRPIQVTRYRVLTGLLIYVGRLCVKVPTLNTHKLPNVFQLLCELVTSSYKGTGLLAHFKATTIPGICFVLNSLSCCHFICICLTFVSTTNTAGNNYSGLSCLWAVRRHSDAVEAVCDSCVSTAIAHHITGALA